MDQMLIQPSTSQSQFIIKPTIIRNILLLSPGRWNDVDYTELEIQKAFHNTDWNDRKFTSLYLDHQDTKDRGVGNWVGYVQNVRLENSSLFGDLEIWNPMIGAYLSQAKAKFGISATLAGRENKRLARMEDFHIESLSIVTDPACKPAMINLSENNIDIKTITMENQIQENSIELESVKHKERREDIESIGDKKDFTSALKALMVEEKKAPEEYENLKSLTDNPEFKKSINEIISDEQKHYKILEGFAGKSDLSDQSGSISPINTLEPVKYDKDKKNLSQTTNEIISELNDIELELEMFTLPGGAQPPQSGDAPQEVKDIIAKVYEDAKKKYGGDKERAAKIAWGAVHNAGWNKNKEGKWVKENEIENQRYEKTDDCDLAKVSNFEEIRKQKGMSVSEFYAVPRDPPSSSSLPIFDAAHVRNAIARFNQTHFSSSEKTHAWSAIVRAAKKFDIEVSSEKENSENIQMKGGLKPENMENKSVTLENEEAKKSKLEEARKHLEESHRHMEEAHKHMEESKLEEAKKSMEESKKHLEEARKHLEDKSDEPVKDEVPKKDDEKETILKEVEIKNTELTLKMEDLQNQIKELSAKISVPDRKTLAFETASASDSNLGMLNFLQHRID